jgi:phosphopantothenoylcysteine decarboxylase / phosphopantothenate---cysteine ligase
VSRNFNGRKVILGVTGSIAAYKSAELARILVKKGYLVRVILTDSAACFIGHHTFEAITGNPVTRSFWETASPKNIEHIEIADWGDVFVIAPASADCIAKLNAGMADSPLLATALATKSPLLIAPAMNVNMFEHPAVQANINSLKEKGVQVVDPDSGYLACGWQGKGRLAEPIELYSHIRRALAEKDFQGKRVVVTAGPTREIIDSVRFITNRSSGKMGAALAREAFRRGAEVTVVHGPVKIKVPGCIPCIPVETGREMSDALRRLMLQNNPPDVIIMAAAVSDIRPKESYDFKIKKEHFKLSIECEYTDDILGTMGHLRGDNPFPRLIGFAVETTEMPDLEEELKRKLHHKKIDIIVGNMANEAFDLDTNRVWILNKSGSLKEVATAHKDTVANKILDSILKL